MNTETTAIGVCLGATLGAAGTVRSWAYSPEADEMASEIRDGSIRAPIGEAFITSSSSPMVSI